MKLCFSIDALSSAGNAAWRLTDDGETWRQVVFAEDLQLHDAEFHDKKLITSWIGRRLSRDKHFGLKLREKSGKFDFLMRGIFAHAIVHRRSPAPIPDKNQLIETVNKADPGHPWLIYLDLAGNFQAIDTDRESIIANISIAVRGEIASSPDYVGKKAAENVFMMDELFRQFLGGWYTHLKSRRSGVFVPDVEKLAGETQFRQQILDWKHEG